MHYNTVAATFPFEFLIIRYNVKKYLSDSMLTALDKKYLYPLNATDKASLSLTDRVIPAFQVRFSHAARGLRNVSRLARKIANIHQGHLTLETTLTPCASFQALVNALIRMGITPNINYVSSLLDGEITTDEKKLAIEILKGPIGDQTLLEEGLHKIINANDMFTAERLIDHLNNYFPNPECTKTTRTGIIKLCVDKLFEAEYYYQSLWSQNNALIRVKSGYPLAMLYLRHHKKNQTNFAIGKDYLSTGYKIIESASLNHLEEGEKTLLEVLYKNGYALVLFKEKKFQAAINLLEQGIKALGEGDGKYLMLKSVTIYNICQCHKAWSDDKAVIAYYQRLFAIDNAFPEYHLELALYQQKHGKLEEAQQEMECALEFDPLHSDTLYHYGLLLKEKGNNAAYIASARLAWEIAGSDITAYNYAYACSLQDDYSMLEKLRPPPNSLYYPGWLTLQAECCLTRDPQRSLDILQQAVQIWPDDINLAKNRESVRQMLLVNA